MCQVYPSSTFLFPDTVQQQFKMWGTILTMPSDKNPKLIVPNSDICPKCGAFRTPQTGCCPICDPIKFYDEDTTLYSLDYKIKKKESTKLRLFCLVFDLSIQESTLHDILFVLASQIASFHLENAKIMIILLCQCPIYVYKRGEMLHIAFEQVFYPDSQYYFNVNEIQEIFEELSPLIEQLSRNTMNPASFTDFVDQLKDENIASMILFHSFAIPAIHNIKFKLHSIFMQQNESIPQNLINSSIESNFSFIISSVINRSLIDYIATCFEEPHHEIKTSIILSEGFEICWISFTSFEKNIQDRKYEFNIKSACKNSTISFAINPSAKYKKVKLFSMQIKYFADSGVFVTNRIFQKAETFDEWITSLNPIVLASIFARQIASHKLFQPKLGIFHKSFTWKISALENQKNITILLKRAISCVTKIFTAEPALLPPEVVNVIFFNIVTQGYGFIADFINSLIGNNPDKIIAIPPFLLYCKKEKNITNDDLNSYDWYVTPIAYPIDKNLFEKIKAILK